MADPVFVHIGPPKTGTEYLQAVLWGNRAALKDQGLLVPGRNPARQFHAVADLLGREPTGGGAERRDGSWDALADQLRAWHGHAIISHEDLGLADAEQAERAKLSLEANEVHVIFTAREFSRVLPALWQELLTNRSDIDWTDFLAALVGTGARGATSFWHQFGGAGLLAWAAGLPAHQVHVVTLPATCAPPEPLWERFASVIGIDPATCSPEIPRTGSLGIAESALLRRFNEAWTDISLNAYHAHVRDFLVPQVLAQREECSRIAIRPDEMTAVAERDREFVEVIKTHGFDVVGDLDDLAPPDISVIARGRGIDEISDHELLKIAIDAVGSLVDRADAVRAARQDQIAITRRTRRELRETRRRLDEMRALNRRLHRQLDAAEAELARPLLRRAVSHFCDRHQWAGRLRSWVRREMFEA